MCYQGLCLKEVALMLIAFGPTIMFRIWSWQLVNLYARRNFDLAHELGHLLLHRAVDFELLDINEHDLKEQEANEFASSLLLPENEFKKTFEKLVGTKVSQPDRYIPLKQYFNVSIQALEYKAFKLGYLTPAQNSYFYRQIHKKIIKYLNLLTEKYQYISLEKF